MTTFANNPKADHLLPAEMIVQRFAVNFEYPVCFTRGLFDDSNPLLERTLDRLGGNRPHRAVAYVDAGVVHAHPDLLAKIKEYFHSRMQMIELATVPVVVSGGEAAKAGWEPVREVMWNIGNLHLDRQSFVIAIGGGAILDMVGFAAAIVHRGLRLIRVPTTTLAQNDAGVGVKNGMNEHAKKNFVGTFAPPFAVLNDFNFLSTLPQQEWISGVAEAFKVAIIKDAAFFDFLHSHAEPLRLRDAQAMERVVTHCARLHLEHIRNHGDPFEFGSARPLDFGHWAGHKLEMMSRNALGHGKAVAIGIALDSFYAMRKNILGPADFDRIVDGLLKCGLPIWSDYLDARGSDGELIVLEGLNEFREHLGGSLTITLPQRLGSKIEVHHMDVDVLEEAIKHLKMLAGRS